MHYLWLFLTLLFHPGKGSMTDPPGSYFPSFKYVEEKAKIPMKKIPESGFSNIQMIPDLFFECHIAELNRKTCIALFYDASVRHYINLYFTERKDQIGPILKETEKYFPVFEKYLEEYHLPEELKFLPILESALSTTVESPSQAVGLWQFKKETGSQYGLRIDEYKDERTDPEASTIAACKYLAELFDRFGDWHMTLMAYQAGPGTISRAIETSGGETGFHDLILHLPEQTQNYLPAYIAVIYIFTYYEAHLF